MEFSLKDRTASLSVGEFADFSLGPRSGGSGGGGLWRAQLGTHWHQELRRQTAADVPAASFEIAIAGQVFHAGWTLTLTGRIDQWVPFPGGGGLLREIKTVIRPLPVNEEELRTDYPEYFAQLATYVSLKRIEDPALQLRAELLFVEAGSGLAQPIALTTGDEHLFRSRLDALTEFLNLRLRASERLRQLEFRPAFTELRSGQETTQAELTAALARSPIVSFEAPTGFGKTGALLECALGRLKAGQHHRLLYLTSKSTGQLQVMRTLESMTTPGEGHAVRDPRQGSVPMSVAAWHVRNKAEHCVNHVFRCTREACGYLNGVETRWPKSGLSRFYLLENEPRDVDSLRRAGREAQVCPYEITRTALAFNDVWVGDYNYVFAPRNRSLFHNQPGFDPSDTLLILDEAHNLPSRVADAYSHVMRSQDAREVLVELDHQRAPAPLVRSWEAFTHLLAALPACDALDPHQEDDLRDAIERFSAQLQSMPLDYAAMDPRHAEVLWQVPELAEWLDDHSLSKLLWSPREGELHFTCLDAAPAIAETLQSYGGVILASATIGRPGDFAEAIGLSDAQIADVSPGRVNPPAAIAGAAADPEQGTMLLDNHGTTRARIAAVVADTPWRDGAYDVGYDVRVDTTYQQRERHQATTATTIEALHQAAQSSHASTAPGSRSIVVFFPSYRYAESIQRELDRSGSVLRIALQPRLPDLAAQSAWMEESLAFADALFLVLGSSFAEGIDALGGRVTHAMVVGPALPEVNAVQRARLASHSALGREAAFRRVYQIPGIQKVNQALGRLVRAPGQHAKVLLHCRRFIEPAYASLLAKDYQFGATIATEAELTDWLRR